MYKHIVLFLKHLVKNKKEKDRKNIGIHDQKIYYFKVKRPKMNVW